MPEELSWAFDETLTTRTFPVRRRQRLHEARHQPVGEQEMAEMIARKSRLVTLCRDHPLGAYTAGIVDEHMHAIGERGDLVRHACGIRQKREIAADHVDPCTRRGRSANVGGGGRRSLGVASQCDHMPTRAASARAAACPTPELAPVTTATRPSFVMFQAPVDRAFLAPALDVIIGHGD